MFKISYIMIFLERYGSLVIPYQHAKNASSSKKIYKKTNRDLLQQAFENVEKRAITLKKREKIVGWYGNARI